MTRRAAVMAAVAAVTLAAARAGAEEPGDVRWERISAEESATLAELSGTSRELADQCAGEGGRTVVVPDPVPLSADELETMRGLASEHPELADQSGGYVSNDELLTILLIVLIVVLIL